MISRIRLKVPIWLKNPEKLHELLQQVEQAMGGTWDSLEVEMGDFIGVYRFVPYHKEAKP